MCNEWAVAQTLHNLRNVRVQTTPFERAAPREITCKYANEGPWGSRGSQVQILSARPLSCVETSCSDVSRHGSHFALLREGVLWFLGLVVAGGVDDQLAEQFPGVCVDDADVVVVDQEPHSGAFVGAANADVVQP